MADHTRVLSSNTAVFIKIEPQVAVLINEIIHALYLALRWHQSSKSFLTEILTRLSEREYFECGHEAFSADLFPCLDGDARKVKISRWNRKIKDDQKESKYTAIWIETRRAEQLSDGSYRGFPTRYRRGDFWNLFKCVQYDAEKCDLLNLPLKNQRERIRAVVRDYLKVVGAIPVDRTKKDEKTNPPKPSLPCRCACPSCATCAAKAPASEPEKKAEIRITKEGVEDRLHSLVDAIYDCGVDWMNLDLEHSAFAGKLVRDFDEVVMRLREGVKRHNAPRKLKLIGGQAK